MRGVRRCVDWFPERLLLSGMPPASVPISESDSSRPSVTNSAQPVVIVPLMPVPEIEAPSQFPRVTGRSMSQKHSCYLRRCSFDRGINLPQNIGDCRG